MYPAGTLDLASLSFHVPICGLWARDTAAPAKHSARVNARVFIFIFFLLFKTKEIPEVESAGNYTRSGGRVATGGCGCRPKSQKRDVGHPATPRRPGGGGVCRPRAPGSQPEPD